MDYSAYENEKYVKYNRHNTDEEYYYNKKKYYTKRKKDSGSKDKLIGPTDLDLYDQAAQYASDILTSNSSRRKRSSSSEEGRGLSPELFHLEAIDDELGQGFRVISNQDMLYEFRDIGDAYISLYREERRWSGKVHFPDQEGISVILEEAIDRVDEEYGLWGSPSFITDLEDEEEWSHSAPGTDRMADRMAAYYQEVPDIDIPLDFTEEALAMGKGVLSSAGRWGSIMGGSGSLVGIGMAVGEPLSTMYGIIAVFGALFGGVGTAAGMVLGAHSEKAEESKTALREEKAQQYFEDVPEEGLFEQISERNALEVYCEESGSGWDATAEENSEKADRLQELKQQELDKAFDTVKTVLFQDLEDMAGLTIERRAFEYEDAVDFVATVVDEEVELEQPSIYTSPDAFAAMFDQLVFEEDGEPYMLAEAEQMLDTVMEGEEEEHEEVREFLDTEYPELVVERGEKILLGD